MGFWEDAINTVRPRSLADILFRPSHHEEGLGASFHPEEYGATDDLRLAAAYGDDAEGEGRNHATRQEAIHREARDMVQALGLNDPGEARERQRKDRMVPEEPSTTRPTTPTTPTTPENYEVTSPEGRDDDSVFGAGLLSSMLRLQAIQKGLVNEEYLDSDAERKVKWYQQQGSGSSTPHSTSRLSTFIEAAQPRRLLRHNKPKEHKLTIHVADILARQRYMMQLCRAFMAYGAPTHRLEQYMRTTANILDVRSQFLYIPGCMVISFDDIITHTTQVKLVRSTQGIDLGRLNETHNIYKNVTHDVIGADEASEKLDRIFKRRPRYNKPLLVLLYGLASAAIGPWAFDARPIDLPISFILGSLVGFMQHVVAPHSDLFSNVFEVSMAIITSFIARALGSIPATELFQQDGRKYTFCFSSIAQSSICLILPGFSVLCSSLELQSHQMVAGSVRMVYTIIYSLFLGYGVTIGTTIYGLIDDNASTESTCPGATELYGNEYIQHFPFVAAFCCLAGLVNQARFRQTPAMMMLGLAGYTTNYFCSKRLGSSSGLANTVGAFAIGTCANLYSRIWHGHAATAIIPGIFTLVSSGLAATGAIISGLSYSEAVKEHDLTALNSPNINGSLTGLGLGMVQVAIGVSVGLFISAVLVYPSGKQRSGLFNL